MKKYFCTEFERVGTCYHEFQKGEFCGEFWKVDSLLIHDDVLCQTGMDSLLQQSIEGYSPYGETTVNATQWESVQKNAAQAGQELQQAIKEADAWVQSALKECAVFSILGV